VLVSANDRGIDDQIRVVPRGELMLVLPID
jgi:hypothetical protein